VRRRRVWGIVFAVVAAGVVITIGASGGRAEARCAVLDCETGKIIDDGCANGVCLKCVMPCARDVR
jgi:hypothetical protein